MTFELCEKHVAYTESLSNIYRPNCTREDNHTIKERRNSQLAIYQCVLKTY